MATPVFWEGNIGSAPEHRSFPNGNNPPRQLLRLNVMFDNSIPDGQGGYKDRGGFWCSVEWWHQDAQRSPNCSRKVCASRSKAGRSWTAGPTKSQAKKSRL